MNAVQHTYHGNHFSVPTASPKMTDETSSGGVTIKRIASLECAPRMKLIVLERFSDKTEVHSAVICCHLPMVY